MTQQFYTSFLLDTNALLWYFWGDNRMDSIKEIIQAEEAEVFMSVVSLWEITVKVRMGKLKIDLDELRFFARKHAFPELPITGEYIKAYRQLPNLHRDPFDHMLLAQAISCPMRLITGDSLLADYSPLVMVI
ncbi:MAG: type II toxin-antitoxin system VapC family toxin [Treponema sp.]|jgi:PIN domain nuclease of toxin-antitoxin system|nr:type II toxin-antitoxin system VapC family toxin [Treponema sp.]